jgi:hypothetical protein
MFGKLFKWRSGTPADDIALFTSSMHAHIARLAPSNDNLKAFFERHLGGQIIGLLAGPAAEKMTLSQADGREHSFAVAQPPVYYELSTLRASIPEAKQHFGKHYGGFSNALETTWRTPPFQMTKCKIHVYMVYGRVGSNAWIDMALVSLDDQAFPLPWILPADLMTDAERSTSRT